MIGRIFGIIFGGIFVLTGLALIVAAIYGCIMVATEAFTLILMFAIFAGGYVIYKGLSIMLFSQDSLHSQRLHMRTWALFIGFIAYMLLFVLYLLGIIMFAMLAYVNWLLIFFAVLAAAAAVIFFLFAADSKAKYSKIKN